MLLTPPAFLKRKDSGKKEVEKGGLTQTYFKATFYLHVLKCSAVKTHLFCSFIIRCSLRIKCCFHSDAKT